MDAVTGLDALLRAMDPVLDEEEFVYASLPAQQAARLEVEAVCRFHEREGVTLILRREDAERCALPFVFPCRRITLLVHSSLDAVGFLAKIASRLADRGVPCNCISAYHHDHLFIPLAQAGLAMSILRDLQREQ